MRRTLLLCALALCGCVHTDGGLAGWFAEAPDDPRAALQDIEDRLVRAPYVSFRIPTIERTLTEGTSTLGPSTVWENVEIVFGPEGRMRVTATGPHPEPELAADGVVLRPSLVTDGEHAIGGRYGSTADATEFDGPWGASGEQDRQFWVRLFLREGVHVLLNALTQGHTGVYTDLDDPRPVTADVLPIPDSIAWGSIDRILGRDTRELRLLTVRRSAKQEIERSLVIDIVQGLPMSLATLAATNHGDWTARQSLNAEWTDWSFSPIPDSVFAVPG